MFLPRSRTIITMVCGGPIMQVRIDLKERAYDLVITTDDPAGIGPFARARRPGRLAVIVTDEHVALPHARPVAQALEAAGFDTHVVTLPAGEVVKSLTSAARLYDELAALRADRKTLIAAVGGGVI